MRTFVLPRFRFACFIFDHVQDVVSILQLDDTQVAKLLALHRHQRPPVYAPILK